MGWWVDLFMEIIHKWAYQKKFLQSKKLVFVDNVDNGLACNCICTKCGGRLVAKANEEDKEYDKESHFAHYNQSDCNGESAIHIEAKRIIKKEKKIRLPSPIPVGWEVNKDVIRFDNVNDEKQIKGSNYKADLVCQFSGKILLIEIVCTSDIKEDKREYLIKNQIPTIRLYFRNNILDYNQLPDNMDNQTIYSTNRDWVFNPEIGLADEQKSLTNELIEDYLTIIDSNFKKIEDSIDYHKKEIEKLNNEERLIKNNLHIVPEEFLLEKIKEKPFLYEKYFLTNEEKGLQFEEKVRTIFKKMFRHWQTIRHI